MSTRGYLLLALVLGAGAVLVWLGLRSPESSPPASVAPSAPSARQELNRPPEPNAPVRPSTPPVPGRDEPPPIDEPSPPPNGVALRLAAYQQAVERQDPRPGEQAFRAMVSAFMEYNHRFAVAQAEAEGIGLDEVEELTYFGLMAQESQRWGEVEQLLDGPVDPETRAQAATLLDELNTEFKQSMRDLVKEGVSVEDRWALIRSVQEDYRQRYFDLTGMDEDQLDDLLAGDASRDYAPGSTPPPEDIEPRQDGPVPIEPRQGEPVPEPESPR
ncbi:MAG: hypothetical protein AAGF11_01725 [Myxococcota bacterium]